MTTYLNIEEKRAENKALAVALIDPDSIYDKILNSMIDTINSSTALFTPVHGKLLKSSNWIIPPLSNLG